MRLKELRMKKNITQKDLAATLGVPSNTYNQWENCKREPDYKALFKIADYFGVTIDFLLGHEPLLSPTDNSMSQPDQTFPSRYHLLDEFDKAKVEAYIDGLLTAEKYVKQEKRA